jgi:uncharacterized OB-fold protein
VLFDPGEEVNMSDYKQTYWQKLKTGELWLQYCIECQQFIFYPRETCPHCLQSKLEWQPVSGLGIVYSYTIVNVSALPEFIDQTPYIYAIIELAEGVKLPSNIIDCPLEQVQVGLPVKLTMIKRGENTLPVFTPA